MGTYIYINKILNLLYTAIYYISTCTWRIFFFYFVVFPLLYALPNHYKYVNAAYAVKVCDKAHILKEKKQNAAHREKHILSELCRRPHPLVIGLHCTFHDEARLYFVVTYAKNGSCYPVCSFHIMWPLNCFDRSNDKNNSSQPGASNFSQGSANHYHSLHFLKSVS